MSTNQDGDNLYGYLLALGTLPEGIHSLCAEAGTSVRDGTSSIAFKWRAKTPEANVEMSKLFYDVLSRAGSYPND